MGDFKFIHVGDVHIGRERLDGRLPSKDFADAFDQAVTAAVDEHVDFVLVAGDFFDKARIEPNHLAEGEAGLRRLREAAIPVVAIEGNHDVVSSYDPRPSWLTYLNQAGLLRLLRTEFRNGKPLFKEWTDADRTGNWLDIGDAHIVGAGWFGASTAKRLELMAPGIEKRDFTILMLHAGVNGVSREFGMIDLDKLGVVRSSVDYLALGHVHRAYHVDGWIHNAGAMENWDLLEAEYGDEKGYLLVAVHDGKAAASLRPVKRRPVLLPTINCAATTSQDDVLRVVREAAATYALPANGVIRATLALLPPFEVDPRAVAAEIEKALPLAAVSVQLMYRGAAADATEESELPRDLIARDEIERLINERGKYGGQVELVRELIDVVLSGRTDEELFEELFTRARPLIEKQDATAATPAPERQVVR